MKKIERKTAKVAPLVPISRKSMSALTTAKKTTALATPKKPISIAPRTVDSSNRGPPQLIPKLQEIKPHPLEQQLEQQKALQQQQQQQQQQQSAQTQSSQSTLLLAAIRLPHQQVVTPLQQQQQLQQHQQNLALKSQTKLGTSATAAVSVGAPLYQLHATPAVLPKLVQIPNILTKETANLMMNTNSQLARMNNNTNNGINYFLNGAVIKFQQIASNGTASSNQQSNNDLVPPQLAPTVPFTSATAKTLPPPLHQQQHQQQQPHTNNNTRQNSQVQQSFASASSAGQYASQPMFVATSSGLLLSTALPTVITSQLSGIQAMPALHQFNQQTSNILPNLSTLLQQSQHNTRQPTQFLSAHTNWAASAHHHHHHHQQHHQQTILQTNIPSQQQSSQLTTKLQQATYATNLGAAGQQPQIFFTTTSMPSLVSTSATTPTTTMTSACMTEKELTHVLPQKQSAVVQPQQLQQLQQQLHQKMQQPIALQQHQQQLLILQQQQHIQQQQQQIMQQHQFHQQLKQHEQLQQLHQLQQERLQNQTTIEHQSNLSIKQELDDASIRVQQPLPQYVLSEQIKSHKIKPEMNTQQLDNVPQSQLPQQPPTAIVPPSSLKLEIATELDDSLNIASNLPTSVVTSCSYKGDKLQELCSPTVPLLSPKIERHMAQCLPSPKSLVLEKIQQHKLENQSNASPDCFQLMLVKKSNDLLKMATVETEFHTAALPECAKSPILSQPKTIRFPAANSSTNGVRCGIRKSDGRVIGVCYWDDCSAKYDSSSKLLDHLQTQHVNAQSGPFTCQWSGCKVHGHESCSRRWLERHVLSHGGTKQFKCIFDGCGLRFGSHVSI